jgi:large subunit ribosomal protein L14e
MMDIGRLCVKIAGRDAGKKCVIVDIIDEKFVLVDGETRRRKCNLKHLEPLNETLKIKKGAAHPAIVEEFKKMGSTIVETKPRKAAPKLEQVRAKQRKTAAAATEEKKPAEKKAEKAKQ